jgi:glycosyltransferase involved in cell wall biosynthesis
MKVALVHDYIKEFGGAERVLETLHEIYPDADVYTSVYLPKFLGPHIERFDKWKIYTSFFQYFPLKEKLISLARFIAPLMFYQFDLTKYDLVITSTTGTYTSPNYLRVGDNTLHICYCHTPPRYLYGYAVANDWTDNWFRRTLLVLGQIPMHFLRILDFKFAQRPDYFISNSNEVASRINKFYRRDAVTIYPPVELEHVVKDVIKQDFLLAGGRLSRAKRIDLAIEACKKLNLNLKVFGKGFGNIKDELSKIASKNIEFVGEVTDSEKMKLFAQSKGYILPADNEDFGIVAVESMASGTPVIAYNSGGLKESVIDGKTGIFFDELDVKSVVNAIKRFNKMKFKPEDCINQAKKFSKERFKKEMLQFVNAKLKEK